MLIALSREPRWTRLTSTASPPSWRPSGRGTHPVSSISWTMWVDTYQKFMRIFTMDLDFFLKIVLCHFFRVHQRQERLLMDPLMWRPQRKMISKFCWSKKSWGQHMSNFSNLWYVISECKLPTNLLLPNDSIHNIIYMIFLRITRRPS